MMSRFLPAWICLCLFLLFRLCQPAMAESPRKAVLAAGTKDAIVNSSRAISGANGIGG
jgi:hypothetical protein